jgi:hypothetical protein
VHLQFPTESELLELVSGKLSADFYSEQELGEFVIPHFMEVRKRLKKKKPSVSEFLHWVTLLERMNFNAKYLTIFKKLPDDHKHALFTTYSVLAKTEEDVNLIREFMDI